MKTKPEGRRYKLKETCNTNINVTIVDYTKLISVESIMREAVQ